MNKRENVCLSLVFVMIVRHGKLPDNRRRRSVSKKRKRKNCSGKLKSVSASWRSRKWYLKKQKSDWCRKPSAVQGLANAWRYFFDIRWCLDVPWNFLGLTLQQSFVMHKWCDWLEVQNTKLAFVNWVNTTVSLLKVRSQHMLHDKIFHGWCDDDTLMLYSVTLCDNGWNCLVK